MTDKEIIKALECCMRNSDSIIDEFCEQCPYQSANLQCIDEMLKDAHHLITCQQSQIEDLKEALEERMQRIKALEAEVERLQDHNLLMARKHYDDGVREFAERLKTYFITPAQTRIDTEIVELIETLVKEMTEDTDNV